MPLAGTEFGEADSLLPARRHYLRCILSFLVFLFLLQRGHYVCLDVHLNCT